LNRSVLGGNSKLQDFKTSKDFTRLHNRDFKFSQNFKRLPKTSKDFKRLQETSRDFKGLQETSRDFMRLHRTSWDFMRLQNMLETSKDFMISWDFMSEVTLFPPRECYSSAIVLN
jgi:hypothetical protein